MSEEKKSRSLLPGLILIAIGIFILVRKFDIYDLRFRDILPFALIAIGIWFFYRLFAQSNRSAAFPGTLFLLLGVFILLGRYSYTFWRLYDFHEFWPIILIIVGLAFLAQFFARPKDWGLLIPCGALVLVGSAFLARNMGWYYVYDLEYYLQQYWPIALILIGVALILSNLRRKASSG